MSLMQQPPGATPLTRDELAGLKVIATTREELDEFEFTNIAKAMRWAKNSRKVKQDLFNTEVILQLHRKMFCDVWEWAGEYRRTETNIGVAPHRIPAKLAALCENAKYWETEKVYPPDELGVVLHHKLVSIHPFPNGNGRHARFVADLYRIRTSGEPYSWANKALVKTSEQRQRYLTALRQADGGDYQALMDFACGEGTL